MELGWEGATTAAREEARKEAVLEVLRALSSRTPDGVSRHRLDRYVLLPGGVAKQTPTDRL